MATPSFNRSPLYRQVADALRQEILAKYSPGDRLESEEQLAVRCSVSLVTLRQALNILSSEGLISRRQGKGTFVSRARPEGQIAVLIERDISHPRASYFFLRVAQQTRRFFEEQGLKVRLYPGLLQPGEISENLTCHSFLEDLEAGAISGVVAIFANPHPSWCTPLEQRKIPLVGIGRQHSCMIDTDPRRMVREGVRLLARAGRRRIALLTWDRPPGDPGAAPAGARPFRDAFLEALSAYGLPAPREGWLRHHVHPAVTGAGWEQMRDIWMTSPEKPDGLLVTDEYLFRDAVTAILDLGIRVPEDLMIVSNANKGSGVLYPFPITTLEVDPDEVAETLARLLQTLMQGKAPRSRRLSYKFRILSKQPPATLADSRLRGAAED
jgi:GntR family transcriptional regulator, arabinose operon transcriptional repressor